MSTTFSDNYLQDLLAAGNDAHSNLYRLEFTGGEFDTYNASGAMSIRTSGFTPPSITHGSYTVKYITAYVDWPNGKPEITRNFNINFRLDANWNAFKILEAQKNKTLQASQSFAATWVSDPEKDLFNVKVYVMKDGMHSTEASAEKLLYEFNHCWITKLDTPSFSNSNSEGIKIQCTINFIEMKDLESAYLLTTTDAALN